MNVIDRARRLQFSPKEGWVSDGRELLRVQSGRQSMLSYGIRISFVRCFLLMSRPDKCMHRPGNALPVEWAR